MSNKPTYEELEQRIKGLEKKFRTIFHNANDGILICDILTKKFIMANKIICKMLGYSQSEILNLSINDIHPTEKLPIVHKAFEKQVKKELKIAESICVKRKDGTIFYADISSAHMNFGENKLIVGIFRDITERKLSEKLLKESEAHHRSLIFNIPGMVYRANVDWSTSIIKHSEILCGYSIYEFNNRKVSWLDLVHPDDKPWVFEEGLKMTERPVSIVQEYRIITKEGQVRWISDHKTSFFNEDGSFIGIDGIAFNISDRIKTIKELKKTMISSEAASQAKSTFLTTMSHELKAPLFGVLTAVELISTDSTIDELKRIKKIISSSGNMLLNTIEHILEFTKLKDEELILKPSSFRLDEALAKIKTCFFYKSSQINIKIDFDLDTENVPNRLIGDEVRLIEVLNHLLENAAKFTTNPSYVTLSINALEKSSDEVLLKFSLIDNGIGISKEYFDKVFKPFYQIDSSNTRQYDGLGIGLAICKQLVNLMNGKIWLESEIGNGSTFFFTLNFQWKDTHEPLNIQLVKKVQKNDVFNQNEILIEPEIEKISPIIDGLFKALLESNVKIIRTYLLEIEKYNIPKRLEFLNRVNNYDYEEAVVVLKKIATEIGI